MADKVQKLRPAENGKSHESMTLHTEGEIPLSEAQAAKIREIDNRKTALLFELGRFTYQTEMQRTFLFQSLQAIDGELIHAGELAAATSNLDTKNFKWNLDFTTMTWKQIGRIDG